MVSHHLVDIVAIVETALQDDERSPRYCPNECLEIPGNQLFRKDNNKEIKGGILTYVKDFICVSEIKSINNMSADLSECMWLQLQIKESKVMFGAIYRKGRSTVTNNKLLNKTIQKVSRMYEKVIICGDFNFPEINWETFNVNAGPYSAPSQFLSCLNNCYLSQNVSEFTRIRGNNKPSLIDLVITENSQTLFEKVAAACVLKWKYLVVDSINRQVGDHKPGM